MMNPTQLKYLKGCVRARILGNPVEFHYRDNIKLYKAINLIVNDARFIAVLDERIGWIGYASNYIVQFINSITDWENGKDWTEKIEGFLVSWFMSHFGEKIFFEDSMFTDDDNEASSDGENDCDDENLDMDFVMKNAFDMTKFDENSQIRGITANTPVEIVDFIKTIKKKESDESQTEIKYLKSIDKSIVDLSLKIGRTGGIDAMYSEKSKYANASRSDIAGITTGSNLSAMLPAETALLGDGATENVFYRRFAEKRLQVFASASSSLHKNIEKKGPIIVCLDTSSSMDGDRADTAKKIALAIAIVAQRTRRTLCVINYSDDLSYFVLTNFRQQKWSFIKFLSRSYGGGNYEDLLFSFIFRSLLKQTKYDHIRKRITGADVLVISDFEWSDISTRSYDDISNARKNGMRFFSLNVNNSDCTAGGKQYLEQCEYQYVCVDGKCVNIK